MEETTALSTQPMNSVKDASTHLTGTDKRQHNMAEQHWLAIGTDDPGMASHIARAVIDGILFQIAVHIVGR